MRKNKLIFLAILLFLLSFASTYLYDAAGDENKGRLLFISFSGCLFFVGSIFSVVGHIINKNT